MTGEKLGHAGAGFGPRTLLDTRDIDEAREVVAAAYCPHSLDVLRRDREFHAVQREASVGTTAVHSLEYGATMLVDPVPLESWLLVSSPVRGRLQVRSGREERNLSVGESVVLDPFRKFSLCFAEDCRLRTIRFDRRLVERVLAHEDLMHAYANSGATVARVAYRWGFGNLGRFARVYAARYGRHPSETLRR